MDESSRWPFRQRARAWLRAVSRGPGRARPKAFEAGGRRVLVMESARLSAGQTVEGFLLVRGDFSCGAGCRFLNPVYVAGACEIGKGSTLDSVEVDGSLHLSPSVVVENNAGSLGEMDIRSGCRIGAYAWSRTSISLGLQASARDLYAPRIATPFGARTDAAACGLSGRPTEIPAPGATLNHGILRAGGIDPRRLRPANGKTWFYDGDLHLEQTVLLRANLLVDGAFSCRPGSLLEGSVKSSGRLTLGENSVANRDLVSGGDVVLETGCIFRSEVRSSQMMRLCAGVRGLGEGKPAKAVSAGELVLEENVSVRGRLISSCRVTAAVEERAVEHRPRMAGGF